MTDTRPTYGLDGKVALITGAGQGLGRGIALALADCGVTVAVVGRTKSKLEETCDIVADRGGRALPIECEITDAAAVSGCVADVVKSCGRLDILINNAQTYPKAALLEIPDDQIQEAWESGPLAALRFMRAAHDHLCGGGVIFNMGSGTQLMHDNRLLGAYVAAKDAMQAFTRVAAVEWGMEGIRTLHILPAASTPLAGKSQVRDPELFQRHLNQIPLGHRLGDPETDVGRAIALLASADAGYITGTTISIDGGMIYVR